MHASDEPRLAWLAHLSAAADRLAETGGWSPDLCYQVAQTLVPLVAGNLPGEAYRASDVERLRGTNRNITRTLQVLKALGPA